MNEKTKLNSAFAFEGSIVRVQKGDLSLFKVAGGSEADLKRTSSIFIEPRDPGSTSCPCPECWTWTPDCWNQFSKPLVRLRLRIMMSWTKGLNKREHQDDPEEEMSAEMTNKLRQLAECPVCFQVRKNVKIFACHNGHIICEKCLPNIVNNGCPTCRTPLVNPGRNLQVT